MKKLLSFILCLAMLCSLGLGAFASGEVSASGDASGEASGGPSGGFPGASVEITGPFEIEETDVECVSHGLTLRGKMVVPVTTDGEKIPMAVLTHGFMSTYTDMNEIAEALGKNGVASVRFNLTGTDTSDGDYVDTTFTTQKEDILNELAFVKTLDFVDTENLFICGKSQGGFDSALAALECEEEINALILWYPAICIPDDFNNGRVQFTVFDPENIPETLPIMGPYSVSRAYIEEGMSIDPLTDFTVFEKDVLIIHGTDDSIVAYEYAQSLADAYPSAEFVTIEGGGHGFMGDGLSVARDATVEVVLDHLTDSAVTERRGEITIDLAENVYPDETWRYSVTDENGIEYPVLRAVYHGSEVALLVEGYNGMSPVSVERIIGETDGSSGEASGPASGFPSMGPSMGPPMEASGDFSIPSMEADQKNLEIVSQFERTELEPLTYVSESGETYSYDFVCYYYVPDAAATESVPVVFALNGIGECGTDGKNLTANRLATCWTDPAWQEEHPCIVVAPQCPEPLADQVTTAIHHDIMDTYIARLKPLFDSFLEEYEPSAVYLTGLSMGGTTCMYFMAANPDYPIDGSLLCCGPANELDATNVTGIPILLAHDMSDPVVKPKMSFDTYRDLSSAGNNDMTLVITYMNYGHGVWEYIYDNPEFMEWLFAQ